MGGVSAPARPDLPTDPSAGLLERIAAEARNPAYEERATRRRPRSQRGMVLTVGVVALLGVLVGVIAVASRSSAESVESERAGLLELAEQRQQEVTELQATVVALEADVRSLREAALSNEDIGAAQAARIDALGVAAGVRSVLGRGALVTVADADVTGGEESAVSRVLDIDLQQVVNGLWEVGAEAVAINGQRIGALTAIRSVQETILVNYEPVIGPYRVTAVGDPRTLPTDFLRSSGGEWLQAVNLSAGLRFSIDSVGDDQRLPAEPVTTLRFADPLSDQTGGAA